MFGIKSPVLQFLLGGIIVSFPSESKVSIVGKYNALEFYELFFDTSRIMGIGTIAPNTFFIENFIEYYVGAPLNWVEPEICINLIDPEAFAQMPSYPNYGYIAKLDDIFVVKLSDKPNT